MKRGFFFPTGRPHLEKPSSQAGGKPATNRYRRLFIRKQVGLNVQRIRRERGWSQEELAFESGLHRTYISGIERGARNPTVLVLGKLAEALGAATSCPRIAIATVFRIISTIVRTLRTRSKAMATAMASVMPVKRRRAGARLAPELRPKARRRRPVRRRSPSRRSR